MSLSSPPSLLVSGWNVPLFCDQRTHPSGPKNEPKYSQTNQICFCPCSNSLWLCRLICLSDRHTVCYSCSLSSQWSVSQSFSLSHCLTVCLSIQPFKNLSFCLSRTQNFLALSMWHYVMVSWNGYFVCLSICPSVRSSVCQLLYLFVCPCVLGKR